MIPSRLITAWSRFAPWLTEEQVEQDLVLSRLIVELANHPVLGEELVFRGGTCLHKLVLPTPLRYSEDLDYVRATHGPIGPILDAIREIAEVLGMEASTDVGSFPKVRLRAPSVGVLTCEADDDSPYLRVDRWAPGLGGGWLGPVPGDQSAVPSQHGVGLDNQERETPT